MAWQLVRNYYESDGLLSNDIWCIESDSKGKLWLSTKAGLYALAEDNARNITKGKLETGKGIGSIAEDKEGNLWFVSNQHFLYRYDGNQLVEFQKTETNKGSVIFQMYKDQKERFWMVGYGGAFRLEESIFVNVTKEGPW